MMLLLIYYLFFFYIIFFIIIVDLLLLIVFIFIVCSVRGVIKCSRHAWSQMNDNMMLLKLPIDLGRTQLHCTRDGNVTYPSQADSNILKNASEE